MAAAVITHGAHRELPVVDSGSSVRHQSRTNGLSAASQSSSGRPFVSWVRSWDDEQVAAWLVENKCGAYENVFRDNDIRGDVLLDVDQSVLKEMGVHSVGDRIKITVAIKKLRAACMSATVTTRTSPSLSSDQLSTVRSSQRTVPPPLHLNAESRLGQAYQTPADTGPLVQQASGGLSASTSPQLATSSNAASSTSSQAAISTLSHGRKGSSPRQQPGPPAAPAPRGGLPPPPTTVEAAQPVPRSREKPPAVQPPLQSRTQRTEYGLPQGPANQRAPSGKFAQQTASAFASTPPAVSVTRAGPTAHVHRRSESLAAAVNSPTHGLSLASRPNTATSALPSHSGSQSLSQHPYATASSLNADAFAPGAHYTSPSSAPPRPSTAPNSSALGPLPIGTNAASLSPILETHFGAPASASADLARSPAPVGQQGFTVGKGAFSRPSTAGGTIAVGRQGLVQTPAGLPPLEDLMRRTVRFTGPDESGSKMISVDGAKDAADVLNRALKRFKLQHSGLQVQTETERGEIVTEIDGWAVFAMAPDGQGARVLPDTELIAICTSANRPERQKGLMIRKVHHHQHNPSQRKLQKFFGESAPQAALQHPPVSPTKQSAEPMSPASSSAGSLSDRDEAKSRTPYNPLNRASTVSVMSGLLDWRNAADTVPLPSTFAHDQGDRSSVAGGPRRLRNFFGHRPPSELISLHLAEYFPSAEKKLLRRSMASRQSLALRPPSQYSSDESRAAWDSLSATSRFSVSSIGSVGSNGAGFLSVPSGPPVPAKDHYAPAPLNKARLSRDPTKLAAPAIHETLDRNEQDYSGLPGDRRSQLSAQSGGSSQRDSDNSLLTVDEITAEVESRRASMVSWASEETDVDDGDDTVSMARHSMLTSPVDEELVSDDDDQEDTDDEVDGAADAEDAEPGYEKVTSSGDRSQIKWIKGAVIGTGSFGVVSLGMVATTGMLMAVKQVSLPTGSSANEERKRSMLTALQREIDLLKILQHPNIVQYLDSSSDGSHLNIFLEYVPGGSIAALLRNYGAFEEALVKNFIRQILTGLNYLHERDIIHRDIKGANILVDNKGGIKISDFGISKRGSVFWMAPEVVQQVPYTSKADIWSIGSVTLEMLTGSHPYPNLSQMQALFRIGSSQTPSPEIPTDVTHEAQDFLRLTFMTNHLDRPSAAHLLEHAFVRVPVDTAQTPTTRDFAHHRDIAPI